MKESNPSGSRYVLILIIIVSVINLIMAGTLGLYADEAYYFVFSKHLDWGYFDHPPMVALMIKAGTWLGKGEWAVRFMFVAAIGATYYALYHLVSPKEYRLFIWCALSLFPLHLMGFTALPDVPVFLFTVLFFLQYRKYLEADTISVSVLLGLCIAGMLYSKYHGILVVFFVFISNLSLVRRKSFYLIVAVSLLAFLPHLIWQYHHEFASLRYHFLDRSSTSFKPGFIGEYLVSFLLFNGPLLFLPLLIKSFRIKDQDPLSRAMKYVLVGFIGFFFLSSFKGRVEANWTSLCIIPVLYLSFQQPFKRKKVLVNLSWISLVLILFFRIHLVFPFFEIKGDRASEFRGHKKFAEEVKAKSQGRPIVANRYQEAAILSFYLNEDIPAINLESRKNQFDFWEFPDRLEDQSVAALVPTKTPGDSSVCHPNFGCFTIRMIDSLQVIRYPSVQLMEFEKEESTWSISIRITARNRIESEKPLFCNLSLTDHQGVSIDSTFRIDRFILNNEETRTYKMEKQNDFHPERITVSLVSYDQRIWKQKSFKVN